MSCYEPRWQLAYSQERESHSQAGLRRCGRAHAASHVEIRQLRACPAHLASHHQPNRQHPLCAPAVCRAELGRHDACVGQLVSHPAQLRSGQLHGG